MVDNSITKDTDIDRAYSVLKIAATTKKIKKTVKLIP